MMAIIYFIILIIFFVIRLVKDISIGFSNKKSVIVTLIMFFQLIIVFVFSILYYYYQYNPFSVNRFHRFFFLISYILVPVFLGYAISTTFVIHDKELRNLSIVFLMLSNFCAFVFATSSLSDMYHEDNYRKGTVYFVGVIRGMEIESVGSRHRSDMITFDCVSIFGPKKVSETFHGTESFDKTSYTIHPELFKKHGYTVGESIIIKMALSDTTLCNFYSKNDLKVSDNYSNPILKIGNNEFYYFPVTNPEQYGVEIVKKSAVEGDSVLVYKNLKLDSIFNPCDKSLNTSANFKKITDYGYRFGNKIYPKQFVEEQFPLVKKYVDEHYNPIM
ncbi:MAG: hypothetical protein PUC50_13100 [Bacteroidales bacterium]|nr:hypothetical protein [Bacteroidales bacterium]